MLSRTDGPIGLRSSSSASSLSWLPTAASASVGVVLRDSSAHSSMVCSRGVSSEACLFCVDASGASEIGIVPGIDARIRACSWYIIRASLVLR
ncbi:hypothetical protein ACFX14_034721 [Malus domestica]